MEAGVVRALVRISTASEGGGADLLREAERTIPILEEVRNYRGLARAWRLAAVVHGTAGRYGAAQQALERVIENARRSGDRRLESRSLPNYGLCALYGPAHVSEAVACCSDLLREATGDRRSESLLQRALAQLFGMQGRFDDARRLVKEARLTLSDLGERVLASSRSLDAARIELLADDLHGAEGALRQDYEALDGMGERYLLSGVAGLLAHTHLLQGRLQEAHELSHVGEKWGGEDAEDQALWRRTRARVYARWDRMEEAVSLAEEALGLVEESDSPVLQANTLMDLAEVIALAGRPEEAIGFTRTAITLFERKGNVVSADRARQTLAGLKAWRAG